MVVVRVAIRMIGGKSLTFPSNIFCLFNFEFHLIQYHVTLLYTEKQMGHALVHSLLEQAWDGLKLLTDVKQLEPGFLKFAQQQKMSISIILG